LNSPELSISQLVLGLTFSKPKVRNFKFLSKFSGKNEERKTKNEERIAKSEKRRAKRKKTKDERLKTKGRKKKDDSGVRLRRRLRLRLRLRLRNVYAPQFIRCIFN